MCHVVMADVIHRSLDLAGNDNGVSCSLNVTINFANQ